MRKNGICQFFPQRNIILTLKTQVNRRTNYIWCWRHCFKLLPTAGNNWEFNPEQSHLLKILLEENCCQIQSNLFSLPLIWQLQSEWKPQKHLHVCTVRAPLGPYFNFHISAWVEAIMAIDMSNMCSSYWEGKKKIKAAVSASQQKLSGQTLSFEQNNNNKKRVL